MVDYREILRLEKLGYSRRQIASSTRSSHHTIKAVLELAEANNISWPIEDSVTNHDLGQLFHPERQQQEKGYSEPDYAYIHKELARPGVTLTLLWSEYCERCNASGAKPYMSTQFSDKYRRWARLTKATMRITHKPGEAMQVDWAGNTIPYYDSVTGAESAAYLFVSVLPCSCYAYVEACADMKLENWLLGHVHAYNYFGGVTRLLIPDNLKTGITSNTRYETVLNRSYQELAEHYGTAVVPARVRHPKDKSLAESTVKYASTWIIAALRNQKFFRVSEVRQAVFERLEELNARPFQKREGSRRSAYLDEEQSFMLPLPSSNYEPAVWTQLKVGSDYLVSDGKNKTYNADDFTVWAQEIGSNTAEVVRFFLTSGSAPEQGYKSCASLTKLAERHGKSRLENACMQILACSSSPSIRNIGAFLRSSKLATETTIKDDSQNRYGITRGTGYFCKGGDAK